MLKKLAIAIISVLVIIQLIPVNLPEVSDNNEFDLLDNNDVPDGIAIMLRETCYDCHSNETVYPWYSYIAPVSFLVARDTREAREHLNFSEWESLSKLDKAEAMDDLMEEVGEGEMPLKIYPLIHPEARLTEADRQEIINWAEEFAELIFED